MTDAKHMLLTDRKAYALQATFHSAARKVAAAAKPDELQSLRNHVSTFVEKAFENKEPEPDLDLDQFLTDSLQRIKGMVEAELKQRVPLATEEVLKEMHKRTSEIRCADCFNGQICDGSEADDQIV